MASPVGSPSPVPSPSHILPQAGSSESSPRTPASAHLKPLRPAFRRAHTAPDRVPSSSLSPLSMSNEHSPFDPPRLSTAPSNATGTKTPKKVSWAVDTSGDTPLVHHGNGMNARDIRQLHHLDEQGLDPNAFQSLKHALEQHQTSSETMATLAGFTTDRAASRSSAPPLSRLSTAAATVGSEALYWNNGTPSSGAPSSFLPSPHSETTESSEPPPDLPERSARILSGGEAIVEGTEVHGLPAPVPADIEQSHAGDIDPATTALLIREGERGRDVNWRRSERKASRLVKAHTRGFKVVSGFRGSHDSPSRSKEGRPSADTDKTDEKGDGNEERQSRFSRFWRRRSRKDSASTNASPGPADVESSAQRPSVPVNPPLNPPLRTHMRSELAGDPGGGVHIGGTGVLSALLALYDRRGGAMTPNSSISMSGRSTPAESEWGEEDEEREEKKEAKKGHSRGWSFGRRSIDKSADRDRKRLSQFTDITDNTGVDRGDGAPLEPPHPLYAQAGAFGGADGPTQERHFTHGDGEHHGHTEKGHKGSISSGLSALGASLSSSHLPLSSALGMGEARPVQARSSGGVFAPLIASTGNLAGAAAPESSRVAPDTTRPGFHLSRYSWSGDRPKEPAFAAADSEGDSKRNSLSWTKQEGKGSPESQDSNGDDETPPLSFTPSLHRLKIPGDGEKRTDSGPSSHEKSAVSMISASTGLTESATVVGGPGSAFGNGAGKEAAATSKVKGWSALLPRSYSASSFSAWVNEARSTKGSATPGTPGTPDSTYESGVYWDEKKRKWVRSDKAERKRRKRKKAEIYITRHVAEIIQRQEFVLKLTRALMMFGAPSHRLPAQIHATARVLDMELSCMYLPDVMLISFDDSSTSTSSIKFIRQGSALDLGKLQDAYKLYWKVIHDKISVSDASRSLDVLMQQKPVYSFWELVVIGGFCSSSICSVSFAGSFIDSLVAFPLGALLVGVQLLSVRNELYSNVFEITIATLLSFLSAILAGTHRFCYSAVASSAVVLILPGFIVLNGSLELSSRNITSGAVRLCYAIMYALFLGFGLSIGGSVYEKAFGKEILGPEDYSCATSHNADGPWYQRTPSEFWAFLTVPMYSLFLSLRNHFPYKRKELLVNVLIACMGWTCNHFSSLKFPERKDVSSAIGAFSVGVVSNIYGRFFSGNAFVIMITGILFQLPSGLGNGGLLTFAQRNNESGSTTSYLSGFQTALQLISVSVGLTVGLGLSLVIVFPIQSRKRQAGVFSL